MSDYQFQKIPGRDQARRERGFLARFPVLMRGGNCRRATVWLVAILLATSVNADVRETPHNLIRSRDKSVSEKQVCVFCHTPMDAMGDAAAGSGSGVKPSWQQSLGKEFAFTIYDDIGRLGIGKPSVGSQSLACLSCHDSNQAYSVGRTSADHPFGVPYRGAKGVGLQNFAAMTRESESIAPFRVAQHLLSLEDFRDVSQGTVEGRTIFWVSSRGVTVRRTRSDLPLYARSTGDPLLEGDLSVPHIECSSCHDPHTKNDAFLRVSATGSQLCLTCHDK